jgi:hypothetical protein
MKGHPFERDEAEVCRLWQRAGMLGVDFTNERQRGHDAVTLGRELYRAAAEFGEAFRAAEWRHPISVNLTLRCFWFPW